LSEPARRSRVLVVDDDDVIRAGLAACLDASYDVEQVTDGRAALDAVARWDPDIVVMDVMMPILDGIEACRQMKARDHGAYRPVLLLTASDERERRNAGLEAGADDFLAKPVDAQELRLRVRSFLLLRQQDAQIRRQLEELRRLDQLKEEVVALVTHDLMNALSGLVLLLDTLGYAGVPCQPRDLEPLRASAGHMHEMIADLRRINQFEAGELVIQRGPVLMADLLTASIGLVAGLARARGVNIVPRVGPGGVAHVDAVLLQRSVVNLLEYAIRGTRRGGSVEARTRSIGANVEIEVHDPDAALGAEARERLFSKYAAVDGSPAEGRSGGHRLRLFLVDLVARAHGGEVCADERAQGGTIYRLVVPVKA
jgi:CheY-like chemotaxis protein